MHMSWSLSRARSLSLCLLLSFFCSFFFSLRTFLPVCTHMYTICAPVRCMCVCAFLLYCCCCHCRCCCCHYCRFPSFYTITTAAVDWLQFILTHRNTYRAHTPHIMCSNICTHGSATIASTHTHIQHTYVLIFTHTFASHTPQNNGATTFKTHKHTQTPKHP